MFLTFQEHPDLGACTAHSGMLIAASAVWDDLEKHGILGTLLNPPKDDSADEDHSMHSTHSTHSAHADRPGQQQQQHQGSRKKVHDGGSGSSRGSLRNGGSPGAGGANPAAHTSTSGGTIPEGAPRKVRPRSDDEVSEADAGARGPEDVSRKTGQLR